MLDSYDFDSQGAKGCLKVPSQISIGRWGGSLDTEIWTRRPMKAITAASICTDTRDSCVYSFWLLYIALCVSFASCIFLSHFSNSLNLSTRCDNFEILFRRLSRCVELLARFCTCIARFSNYFSIQISNLGCNQWMCLRFLPSSIPKPFAIQPRRFLGNLRWCPRSTRSDLPLTPFSDAITQGVLEFSQNSSMMLLRSVATELTRLPVKIVNRVLF